MTKIEIRYDLDAGEPRHFVNIEIDHPYIPEAREVRVNGEIAYPNGKPLPDVDALAIIGQVRRELGE